MKRSERGSGASVISSRSPPPLWGALAVALGWLFMYAGLRETHFILGDVRERLVRENEIVKHQRLMAANKSFAMRPG